MIRKGSVAYRRSSTTWSRKVRDKFDKAYRGFLFRAEASVARLTIPFTSSEKEFDGGVYFMNEQKQCGSDAWALDYEVEHDARFGGVR